MGLKVLHTPVHSKGSISIFIPEKDMVVIGNTVSEKRGIPIHENINEFKKSFLAFKDTEAKYVISSFDGYCNNKLDVVKKTESLISKIDF